MGDLADNAIKVIDLFVGGETAKGVDLLARELVTPKDAFMFAVVYASIIGERTVGTIDTEHETLSVSVDETVIGGDEPAMETSAALIAAVANDDLHGAALLFVTLTLDEAISLVVLLARSCTNIARRTAESED